VTIQILRLPHHRELPLPDYQTAGSAGMDLLAAIDAPVELQPGEHRLIPTGIAVALPPGFEAQIRPRSGLALRHGISVVNSPGTIDADYRGEIGIILINHGHEPFVVRRGDRIAQMVIAPVMRAVWQPVDSLPRSDRGAGGFGSTGRGETEPK